MLPLVTIVYQVKVKQGWWTILYFNMSTYSRCYISAMLLSRLYPERFKWIPCKHSKNTLRHTVLFNAFPLTMKRKELEMVDKLMDLRYVPFGILGLNNFKYNDFEKRYSSVCVRKLAMCNLQNPFPADTFKQYSTKSCLMKLQTCKVWHFIGKQFQNNLHCFRKVISLKYSTNT